LTIQGLIIGSVVQKVVTYAKVPVVVVK